MSTDTTPKIGEVAQPDWEIIRQDIAECSRLANAAANRIQEITSTIQQKAFVPLARDIAANAAVVHAGMRPLIEIIAQAYADLPPQED
jgi:hypothetical protein